MGERNYKQMRNDLKETHNELKNIKMATDRYKYILQKDAKLHEIDIK